MTDDKVTDSKPPQLLRERVRRDHDAALAPRGAFGGLPSEMDREQLAELMNPETLRRNADSFPVLAAFQAYLDRERHHTRRRMAALTLLVLILLVAAGSLAGFLGLTYYRKISRQTTAVQADIATLRAQLSADNIDAATLSNLAERAAALEGSIDQGITALSAEQSDLSTQLAGLHATIARLQNENAQLTDRVERRAAEWESMTNRVDQIMAILHSASVQPPTAQPASAALSATENDTSAGTSHHEVMPARKSLVLAIIPRGTARAIDWRVPLPTIQE